MKKMARVLSALVLALMLAGVLSVGHSYASETDRFYAIVYDCSGERDTVIVVANVSNTHTSYAIEVYDAWGELLVAEIYSPEPHESDVYSLTSMIYEAVSEVDWSMAWGLCTVRPVIYAASGDLFAVSVETFLNGELVDVYQIAPSHY